MCCINGCSSVNPPTNFTTFRPEWMDICTIKEGYGLRKMFICTVHFDIKFIPKIRLASGAVPQYYLHGDTDKDLIPPKDEDDVECEEFIEERKNCRSYRKKFSYIKQLAKKQTRV